MDIESIDRRISVLSAEVEDVRNTVNGINVFVDVVIYARVFALCLHRRLAGKTRSFSTILQV